MFEQLVACPPLAVPCVSHSYSDALFKPDKVDWLREVLRIVGHFALDARYSSELRRLQYVDKLRADVTVCVAIKPYYANLPNLETDFVQPDGSIVKRQAYDVDLATVAELNAWAQWFQYWSTQLAGRKVYGIVDMERWAQDFGKDQATKTRIGDALAQRQQLLTNQWRTAFPTAPLIWYCNGDYRFDPVKPVVPEKINGTWQTPGNYGYYSTKFDVGGPVSPTMYHGAPNLAALGWNALRADKAIQAAAGREVWPHVTLDGRMELTSGYQRNADWPVSGTVALGAMLGAIGATPVFCPGPGSDMFLKHLPPFVAGYNSAYAWR